MPAEENHTEDKLLTCADCKKEFTFDSDSQRFFAENGWEDPKRCKPCRKAKRARVAARESKEGEGSK